MLTGNHLANCPSSIWYSLVQACQGRLSHSSCGKKKFSVSTYHEATFVKHGSDNFVRVNFAWAIHVHYPIGQHTLIHHLVVGNAKSLGNTLLSLAVCLQNQARALLRAKILKCVPNDKYVDAVQGSIQAFQRNLKNKRTFVYGLTTRRRLPGEFVFEFFQQDFALTFGHGRPPAPALV